MMFENYRPKAGLRFRLLERRSFRLAMEAPGEIAAIAAVGLQGGTAPGRCGAVLRPIGSL